MRRSSPQHPGLPLKRLGGDSLVESAAGCPPGVYQVHGHQGLEEVQGARPWKADTFKFSTDPELEAKVTDIVGLYLNPPANAIVLCVDEKSQIQALNRTQKVFAMQPGHNEQRSHDYARHGTTTLFAALEIATGKVTGLCKNRHRHQEFLGFLKHVARAYPEVGTTPGDGQLRRAQASRGPPLAYSKPVYQEVGLL